MRWRRNNTFVEIGSTDRYYFGDAQIDGMLTYRQRIDSVRVHADTAARISNPKYRDEWPHSTRIDRAVCVQADRSCFVDEWR
ncbi:hypothetical protein WS68_17400 [Burkholderia sp. TSV86]|nr:hypothetical protein [Burkholderia sp. TSV86]KVE31057.1 hypothetical protein WS68_17400 [Burkholderia sp. TSV86]